MSDRPAASSARFEERMRAEGLSELAIRSFHHYYALLQGGETGLLSEREIAPVEDVLPLSALPGDSEAAGIAALSRTAIVKLNGGLGTSMGMTRAKSLLPAKRGMSFLEVVVRQVEALRGEHGVEVPLVLMNSFRTRRDSLDRIGADGVRGIPADFLQNKVPRVDAESREPVRWPAQPEHEWCPPGHGDIYPALLSSGMLARLREAGIDHAFVSNADNLGASLDLRVLGWVAGAGIPFAMEVCRRTEADRKGGHLARLADGRLTLREVAQCPAEELPAFQDIDRYRHFNTNNLWIDLRALEEALTERDGILGLPLILNRKPVDPADPSSPPVIQLETAMGAAISAFSGAAAVEVPRSRFAPVKTTGDLLALWSDAYVLQPDYRITPAKPTPVAVDLDPAWYRTVPDLETRFPKGPPSLVDCTRLTVRGDVRFGGHVTCRGDVRVEGVREVPDGSVLGG